MFANSRHPPDRVAILGFNDFERASLASCLRLSEERTPAYVQVDATGTADFRIADADDAATVTRIGLEQRAADTVFVGAVPPDDAVAWLPRPIEPAQVLRALDALRAARSGAEPVGAAEPSPPPSAVARPPKHRPNPATSGPVGGGARRVLVVDDSPIARAFLAQRLAGLGYSERLAGLGYSVETAASADEALGLSAAEAFAIVFLDLRLGDHDALGGLEVCRSIKQRQPAPAVVITTASGFAADRVRGTLVGCDAYLTKPLLADDFTAALRRVDPLFAGAAAR